MGRTDTKPSSVSKKQRRVYIDCTMTFFTGINTGIQRVVRNILRRKNVMEDLYAVECVPTIFVAGYPFEISLDQILGQKRLTVSLGERVKSVFEKIKKRIRGYDQENAFVDKVINRGMLVLEVVLKRVFAFIKYAVAMFNLARSGFNRIEFRKGDVVLLLDSYWIRDLEPVLAKGGIPGVDFVPVIYDLIPLSHPQFCEEENVAHFIEAVPKLLQFAKGFICISNFVAAELRKYIIEQKGLRYAESFFYEYFHLGSDFSTRANNHEGEIIRGEVTSVFQEGLVWLAVGTLEPRKNYDFIIDSFEELWRQGFQHKLCIVGRIGWKCEALIKRIMSHTEFHKKLFYFSDITDSELKFAYLKSEGLIFASFVEGFGLPIVEAKAHGLNVICSDIPSFREVGQDFPKYFDLANKQSLIEALKTYKKKNVMAINPLTWDESANMIFTKLGKQLELGPVRDS